MDDGHFDPIEERGIANIEEAKSQIEVFLYRAICKSSPLWNYPSGFPTYFQCVTFVDRICVLKFRLLPPPNNVTPHIYILLLWYFHPGPNPIFLTLPAIHRRRKRRPLRRRKLKSFPPKARRMSSHPQRTPNGWKPFQGFRMYSA